MTSSTGQPRVWSLWIYDRHCSLLFHADWSALHNRGLPSSTSSAASTLSLSEQSKLVYGVVFSLRNMTRKFSPLSQTSTNGDVTTTVATPPSSSTSSSSRETFHSFNTSTYTLSHLQTPTNYTFIMLTDPIAPPTRRAPSASTTSSSTFSGGGGIPATGGMSTTGVLSQIARGPWVDFVARNPGCTTLERTNDDDDEEGDSDEVKSEEEGGKVSIEKTRQDRQKARQKELDKQRMTGMGKSIDSEAFRGAVEAVLAHNKLRAPRM
ncbi:hypothetical protein CBS101457_005803 [Exobasidium rhododendri]|nr:hypothetical protein CBS101457_005803 [Exobasidium rhododendri]